MEIDIIIHSTRNSLLHKTVNSMIWLLQNISVVIVSPLLTGVDKGQASVKCLKKPLCMKFENDKWREHNTKESHL